MTIKAYTFPVKTPPRTKIGTVFATLANDVQTAINKNLQEVEKIGEFKSLVLSEIDGQVLGTILYTQNENRGTQE